MPKLNSPVALTVGEMVDILSSFPRELPVVYSSDLMDNYFEPIIRKPREGVYREKTNDFFLPDQIRGKIRKRHHWHKVVCIN